MDSLIKQTRARFSGDNKDERDRRIPPQKTQSFRERKRSQSWIRRQFSGQTSIDFDIDGADYPTAIAAAVYAIQSVEESKRRDKKETIYGHDKTLNKMKSKVEDDKGVPFGPLKSALKVSDETSKTSSKDPDTKVPIKMPEKGVTTAQSLRKRLSFAETDENTIYKPANPLAPLRKPPSPADKQLKIIDSKKPEKISLPKPGPPGDSQADAWQKQEMATIKQRYEKLRATIEDWEIKKTKNAKRKIERIEAELDKKRAKAMQRYRKDIARIEGIAGGAKGQAEENRRKEEMKVKEKANKIRLTGKIPATYMCF